MYIVHVHACMSCVHVCTMHVKCVCVGAYIMLSVLGYAFVLLCVCVYAACVYLDMHEYIQFVHVYVVCMLAYERVHANVYPNE